MVKKIYLIFFIILCSCFLNNNNIYADAVVITTSLKSVWGNGHTSVLVQNDSGKWYYFFWGDAFACIREVPAENMENLETFNVWLRREAKTMPTSFKHYSYGTRIKGDFTKSYWYYKSLVDNYKKEQFSTFFKNCKITSFEGLKLGIISPDKKIEDYLVYKYFENWWPWSVRPNTFRMVIERSFPGNSF